MSMLTRVGRNSYARTSSIIAEEEFTTAFIGMRTRVGAFVRPAARRLSTPDTKAVTCMSTSPPSEAMGI